MAAALRGEIAGLDSTARRQLAWSTVPAVLAGVVGQRAVERHLGGPRTTAALLAAGGVGLWLADRRTGGVRPATAGWDPADVRAAALAQVAALAPGVSRTGATLTALRSRGLSRTESYRLSLLMALPVSAGAAGLTAARARALPPVLPTVLAAGSAYLATSGLRPSRRTIGAAVAYRLALAAAVAATPRKERA